MMATRLTEESPVGRSSQRGCGRIIFFLRFLFGRQPELFLCYGIMVRMHQNLHTYSVENSDGLPNERDTAAAAPPQ